MNGFDWIRPFAGFGVTPISSSHAGTIARDSRYSIVELTKTEIYLGVLSQKGDVPLQVQECIMNQLEFMQACYSTSFSVLVPRTSNHSKILFY